MKKKKNNKDNKTKKTNVKKKQNLLLLIKSQYVLILITQKYLNISKFLQIIQHSKKLQLKMNITIETYKFYNYLTKNLKINMNLNIFQIYLLLQTKFPSIKKEELLPIIFNNFSDKKNLYLNSLYNNLDFYDLIPYINNFENLNFEFFYSNEKKYNIINNNYSFEPFILNALNLITHIKFKFNKNHIEKIIYIFRCLNKEKIKSISLNYFFYDIKKRCNDFINVFNNFTKIENINFEIGNINLNILNNFKNIKKITLSNYNLDINSLKFLNNNIESLEYLNLEGINIIDNNTFNIIKNLPNLTYLNFDWENFKKNKFIINKSDKNKPFIKLNTLIICNYFNIDNDNNNDNNNYLNLFINIKTLEIKSSYNNHLNLSDIIIFKNLQYLKINYKINIQIDEENFELQSFYKNYINLIYLYIPIFNNKIYQIFFSDNIFPNLLHLYLNFNELPPTLIYLNSFLLKHNNLETLKLINLNQIKIYINDLTPSLKTFKNLKKLFIKNFNYSNEGLINLCQIIENNRCSLINVKFEENNFNNLNIKLILYSLLKCKKVESISINYSTFDQDNFDILFNLLNQLDFIKKLNLKNIGFNDFNFNKILNIKEFLIRIEKLNLNKNKLTEKSMLNLIANKSWLIALKKLNLTQIEINDINIKNKVKDCFGDLVYI